MVSFLMAYPLFHDDSALPCVFFEERRYKLFIKYPQGLRLTFDRIKERLEDNDNSVVSCAVNVICELADKNPKNYLAMAPQFFRLLTTSSNNWMLIKVRWFWKCRRRL